MLITTKVTYGDPASSSAGHLEPVRLRTCRGAVGCPRAVGDVAQARDRLHGVLERTRAALLVQERARGALRAHDQLTVSVSGCPNACSQPQIADFGLVGVQEPHVNAGACTGCGACVAACPDSALVLGEGRVSVDRGRCLACGACVRACVHGALAAGVSGWRVMVGGRLGRHPRLAEEVGGCVTLERAEAMLFDLVALWRWEGRPHERIGVMLERVAEQRGMSFERVLEGGVRL